MTIRKNMQVNKQQNTYLSQAKKYRVIRRLKISKSHLDKIIKIVESGESCFKVIHQTRAVRLALKKVDQILLEEYLIYCLGNMVKREELQQETHKAIKMFKRIDG